MNSVWVLKDDNFVSLYKSEKDCRREWLALVDAVKNNKYYISERGAKTTCNILVDEGEQHYCVFESKRPIFGKEHKTIVYGLFKVR